MWKRTRIVATLGPASQSLERISALIHAGVDVFRINFSHGTEQQRAEAIQFVREAEQQAGRPIAICGDLCGPKIRVGAVPGGAVQLTSGQDIVIQRTPIEGSCRRISTTLPELVDVVRAGETILLSDGRLRLEVTSVTPPDQFTCRVIVGGSLASGCGVNLPETKLAISALTEKDRHDVQWIAQHDFDFVALSFVQHPDDIRQLRALLEQCDSYPQIIAKIEKPQALQHIEEIINTADAIMVARGDLGVEMDLPSVPLTQKSIAHKCEQAGKPCIIATEMMESMINSPRPTRAEVSDVANAVFDRADAVMLSAESAIGKYPVAAVTTMKRILQAADAFENAHTPSVRLALNQDDTTASLATALHTIMEMQHIAAVAVFTVSGTTARLIAKNRPSCPILALSSSHQALRRCCLYHGVTAQYTETPRETGEAIRLAAQTCQTMGLAKPGENVIILAGYPFEVPGNTNSMIIMTME